MLKKQEGNKIMLKSFETKNNINIVQLVGS